MPFRSGPVLICALFLAGLVLGCGSPPPPMTATEQLRQAQIAMQDQKFARGLELADQILEKSPGKLDVLLLAADAATRLEEYDRALEYYSRMRDDGSATYRRALLTAGDLHRHLGHMSLAEHFFREVLARSPQEIPAIQRLSYLLNLAGRRWEATPYLLQLLQAGQFHPLELLLLGNTERLSHHDDYIKKACEVSPEDPLPWLGLARNNLEAHEYADAEPALQRALKDGSHLAEAQIQQGWWLWYTGDVTGLTSWLSGLPTETQQHPDYWVLQGLAARETGQLSPAARCFGEAVARDPDHRLAMYHLGQVLRESEPQHPVLPLILQRAQLLQQLDEELERLYENSQDAPHQRAVVTILLDLGRAWEAAGWSQLARSSQPDLPWANDSIARAEQMVANPSATPHRRTVLLPPAIKDLDWSQRPLPTWSKVSPSSKAPLQGTAATVIRFEDVATETGLDFQFYNDADPQTEGMRMLEFTGGGVGVLDFDLDGWPDLHFTQGSVFPVRPDSETHHDQLYRNRHGQTWQNVTDMARIIEPNYSQGVAVGDYNGDGFPDLYVANIGTNRLFLNLGDGTFQDHTAAAGISGTAWTTSVAMVDLNADGWPDLYDVNYLSGEGVFTQICQSGGLPRACLPTLFDGEPDALWLNQATDTFADISTDAGLQVPLGNGLGILAADFGQQQQMELFIANDAVPNFFLVPETTSPSLRYENRGVTAGLAFDRDGKAQACMGVASADVDGNGQLDLFVTNYFRESNTLYLQDSPLLFNDRTAAYQLRDSSYLMLGFGTQFLDADLDTWPDLMLVNGHVDDFTHLGSPYRMPPQFLRNEQGQKFTELPAPDVGDWFTQPQLGRSMARLDWNRDGRDDVAVSHLDTPVALVTNRSQTTGHFLCLHLRGTSSNRDAIGTRVKFTAHGRIVVSQLVAGDGYQSSNERKLVLGLGDSDRAKQVNVTWPNGETQHWDELLGDREYVIVEGREPIEMPR